MNKIFLLPILGMALLTVSCGSDEDSVVFKTVTADKTVALTNEGNSPTCAVHLKLEEATEASGHAGELINTAVMKRLLDREEKSMQLAAEAFADTYTES